MVARGADSGFTLIELLVVFAIMGLLLALASPRIQGALPGFELRAAARELASAMREARARAVRTGEPAALVLDVENAGYTVTGGDAARVLTGTPEIAATTTREDIDTRRRLARFRFYPDGTALGGRVTLRRAESSYRVDVDWMIGRVRLLD